ncbi:MAG: hypothetical protein R3F59_16820 [Myxococcota bacterium]
MSRADRRAGDFIEVLQRRGARFDAWREHLDMDAWRGAIEDVGYDTVDALRARAVDERLPWDHIDVPVDKQCGSSRTGAREPCSTPRTVGTASATSAGSSTTSARCARRCCAAPSRGASRSRPGLRR